MTDDPKHLIDQAVSLKARSLTPKQQKHREAVNYRNEQIQLHIKGTFFACKKKGE